MRTRYKIINNEYLYFITSTIVNWIPVFVNDIYYDQLIDRIKFCQNNKALKVYSYVFLDNHFHMIVSCPELSKAISSIKSFSAKKIIEQLKLDGNSKLLYLFKENKLKHKTESTYQIWQESSHPQLISSEDILNQKIEYIHYNPVRRKLVEDPIKWKYSSAEYFTTGKEGIIHLSNF